MKAKILEYGVVGAILVAIPMGIGLAFYFDNPHWLAMSVLAFIVMYAG